MKKMILKTLADFMFIISMGLVIESCQKEQHFDFTTDQNNTRAQTNSNETIAALTSGCNAAVPDSLKVPAGNKLMLQTFANGFQIYQVKRSTTNPDNLVWVNIAPTATIYAKPDFTNQIGTHFAGPSWQFTKGVFKDEKVVAAKLKASAQDPTAIPWLLLKTVDSLSSAGNKITYIQRVCTTGGLAPTIPVAAGDEGRIENVPYTASYLFYTKN